MNCPIFMSGELIDLRVLDKDSDLANYLKWTNDRSVTRYLEVGYYPTTEAQLRKYIERCTESSIFLGIFTKNSPRHIGNIKLHNIDTRSLRGDIGILVGERTEQGKGYGLEAITLMLEHAFKRLNLHKVCAGVNIENIPSIKLFEKAGFQLEGKLREHYYAEDRYYDCLQFGVLKKEFIEQTKSSNS